MSLLGAGQAQAQDTWSPPVWSATLTAKSLQPGGTDAVGCDTLTTGAECSSSSVLSDDDFSLGGQDYAIEQIADGAGNTFSVIISSPSAPGADLNALSFCVGTRAFALSGIAHSFQDEYRRNWQDVDVGWSVDDTVQLSIGSSCAGPPTVTLSASPNPVLEGSPVTVTATLSQAVSSNVDIPVTLTNGTAESGDYGTLSAITIASGSTSGTGQITVNQDTDEDDETFTVALGTPLPLSMTAGTRSSVEVTITDDDGLELSVDTSHPTPACGATVTDLTLRPEMGLRLTPAPAAETETQVRILASYGPAEGWRASLPIRNYDHHPTYGHSGFIRNITFTELQKNFPGFRGFEYRLKDTPGITARCTWQIDDYDSGQQESGAGGQQRESGGDGDGGILESVAGGEGAAGLNSNSALIAQMRQWRNDPNWVHAKDHTDRWDRALLALGESVSDGTLTAMTAAEAQGFADRGWERWVEVAEALRQLETGGATDNAPAQDNTPPQPAQDPPTPLHATLIGQMYDWRNNNAQWSSNKSHTDRWDRALLAFGEAVLGGSLTPMTAAEAQAFADQGWTPWVGVAQALKAVVTGTGSPDTLTGTSAGELLVGLDGSDALRGLDGNDELRGGSGNDDLTGGAGRDRFVFFSGQLGDKEITDFASGDVIVLKGDGWSSVADIIAGVQAVGSAGYRYTLAFGLTVETTNNRPLRTEDFLLE